MRKTFRPTGPRPPVGEAAKKGVNFQSVYCFRFEFWPPLSETLGTAYSYVVDDDDDGLCHFAAVDGKRDPNTIGCQSRSSSAVFPPLSHSQRPKKH